MRAVIYKPPINELSYSAEVARDINEKIDADGIVKVGGLVDN